MITRFLIGATLTLVAVLTVGTLAAGAFDGRSSEGQPGASPRAPVQGGPGSEPQSPPAQDLEGMQRVPAPIEDARIDATAGGGRFVLLGNAGLPGGCAEPAGYEITRREGVIDVDVYILVPADDRPCTKIYSTYHLAIDLGTDIRPGREYIVDVNGTLLTHGP